MKLQTPFGIAAVITAPLALLSLLAWINAFANPLTLAFMDSFQVRNGTARPVAVTPLGRMGGDAAELWVLPQYCCVRPALPSPEPVGRRLEPGETIVVLYDGDDLQLTELLIEAAGVGPRVLPVDQGRDAVASYSVPDLTLLAPASPASLEAVRRHHSGIWRVLLVLFGGLVPAALAAVWYAMRRGAPRPG